VDAEQRFLVLTDDEFHQLLSKKMRQKLSRDIKLLYCPLSDELARLVETIRVEATDEIDRGKPSQRGNDSCDFKPAAS